MIDSLFISSVVLFFVTMVLKFFSSVFKERTLVKNEWSLTVSAFLAIADYLAAKGIATGNLSLSNQF